MPLRKDSPTAEVFSAGTVAIQLRCSAVLREVWSLAAQTPVDGGSATGQASVEHVENTIDVCARGLSDLLATSGTDGERCRSGCLECASSLVRAFARTAPAAQGTRSAVALLRTVDARLISHENSVLSGEQTYELSLDALRGISATVETSRSAPNSGGSLRA